VVADSSRERECVCVLGKMLVVVSNSKLSFGKKERCNIMRREIPFAME